MTTFAQDLRYGLRMLVKTPVVSAVAILSLAVGIAANASMFSVLNAFLFEPLPYRDQDGIVLLSSLRNGEGVELSGGVSIPDFRDLVDDAAGIESATAYTFEATNLTGVDAPEQIQVVVATPSIFDVLGVQPALGRGFLPEDGAGDGAPVLVLHHDYWQSRFFGDRDVLGSSMTLDGMPHTVVGVMPEGFDIIPANVQAFRPSDFADHSEARDVRGFVGFARLRDGATAAGLKRELDEVALGLEDSYPETNRGMGVRVQALRESFPGPTDSMLIRIMTTVTLFGLLIACANVANLLLGRAEIRQKEVAVRTALGASRRRILGQLLTESMLLATVAGSLGMVLSIWVVSWLRQAMPAELPKAMMPELDAEVLAATGLVALLAGVAFGFVPALYAVGGNLRDSLGGGARGGTDGQRRKRVRGLFVVGEVAVALALLSGAGFLVQAFDRLSNDDPGFEVNGLLTFQLAAPEERYPGDAELALYERELVRVLEALPRVEGVAVMSSLPRGRNNPSRRYSVDGRPPVDPSEWPLAGLQAVSEGYFATLGVPLLRGRLPGEQDRADGVPVAVVSSAFAAREFPDGGVLGRSVTFDGTSREIVGVVGDILQSRIALTGHRGEQMYVPSAQAPQRGPSFALRVTGDLLTLAEDVRRAVWSVNPDQPVAQVRTLQAGIDESLAGPRAISLFLTAMGLVALALAAMGIYGVMAHSVTQQEREIGIRMALGASRGSVVGMVTRSGVALVALGLALGLPLAYLMFRTVSTALNLFETNMGWGYPAGLASALVLVGLVATLLPAVRASGVAPVTALRE